MFSPLATLDAARLLMLRVGVRHVPGARAVVSSRDARVVLYAAVGVTLGCACSVLAPASVFLWGPVLLGVPHLLSDLRYLVFAPAARARLRWPDIVVGALLLAAMVSPVPAVGFAAVLASALLTRRAATAPTLRFALATLLGATAMWVSWRAPHAAAYALVHAHNLVALFLFGVMFRYRRTALSLIAGTMFLALAILGGAFDNLLMTSSMSLQSLFPEVLPPNLVEKWGGTVCARVVVVFVFLQGVHYTVWLRLIPEAARARAGMRGFASSAAALKTDMGAVALWATLGLSTALLAYGLHAGAYAARGAYLQLAGFHAYLELAVLARWWCLEDVSR